MRLNAFFQRQSDMSSEEVKMSEAGDQSSSVKQESHGAMSASGTDGGSSSNPNAGADPPSTTKSQSAKSCEVRHDIMNLTANLRWSCNGE